MSYTVIGYVSVVGMILVLGYILYLIVELEDRVEAIRFRLDAVYNDLKSDTDGLRHDFQTIMEGKGDK